MKKEYPDSVKAFLRADEAIKAAVHDFSGGFYGAAANRAYYACYYCITALLYTKDIYVKTHIGAKSKFVELFIKTGVFPIAISRSIASLFELRQTADYDLNATITLAQAEFLINQARDIFKATTEYFAAC